MWAGVKSGEDVAGPGEMASFGDTEQECDKNNGSTPTATQRGTNTDTIPERSEEKQTEHK